MSFADIKNEHTRGALLGLLKAGEWANCSILHQACFQVAGVTASRDQVRANLRWLEEAGLVTREDISANLMRAQITRRGQDFENGAISLDGIKRHLAG